MFVKRNGKNWEKNGTERNGTGKEKQRKGTGEETLRNEMERPVHSHPIFIERASRSTDQTGELFIDAYCILNNAHAPSTIIF